MHPSPDLEALTATLRGCLPGVADAPLHEPCFAGHEWDYLRACLDSGWVSSVGAFVDRFEQGLCDFTGAAHAIATVNGTAALHTCLLLAGVQPGDEVLVPALTFVATANAVAYCGASPHFVEVEEDRLGVDAQALEAYLEVQARHRPEGCINRQTGRPLRALVVMHAFGHPCDLDALETVCERYGLVLVEDAAEALGSLYRGRHVGRQGRLAALSFNGNKVITTGGGGAVLTEDPALAARARHLTTTARVAQGSAFFHDEVGYNYRMPNINAALGCAQLEELPDWLAAKRRLARRYAEALAGFPGVCFVSEPTGCRSNYWLNALRLEQGDSRLRDRLLAATQAVGLQTRPVWTPMHRLPMYRAAPRMALPTTEALADALVNLPSGPALGVEA